MLLLASHLTRRLAVASTQAEAFSLYGKGELLD